MKKNILVYRWDSYNEVSVIHNLEDIGYCCVEFNEQFTDNHTDTVFAEKLLNCIRERDIHQVFSINYFPLLASICEIVNIPYISWIYDYPLDTLMSKTILHKNNYMFCFDRFCAERLARMGCVNVCHFPIGVDVALFDDIINQKKGISDDYVSDISYVGNMGSKSGKWLEEGDIPEYARGYLNGIVEAQSRIYGYNFVREMIKENVARDIVKRAGWQLGELYFDNPIQLAADFVNTQITRKEAESAVDIISEKYKLDVYSDYSYQGNGSVKLVDYYGQMPLIFRNSKINLNITHRSIESGIPLHVLSILACGGFCLTNYQPEIAELFEEGVEIAMYTSTDDLMNKVDWYLEHGEEREAVALAGYQKVKKYFSLREKLSEMLNIVWKDRNQNDI